MSGALRSIVLDAGAAAFGLMDRLTGGPSARVLMRHKFLSQEPRAASLDRLRRELDWLASAYTVIPLSEFSRRFAQGDLPAGALTFTTDDVHRDVFEVFDVFRECGVPLSMFVPIGWTASLPASLQGSLIEAVTLLQWYEGEPVTLPLGETGESLLSEGTRAELIDWLIGNADEVTDRLPDLCARIARLPGSHISRHVERTTCDWSELTAMHSAGVEIASHSISHPRMARMSACRQAFEAQESKRVIDQHFGPSDTFAYPYGTPDSHNDSSRRSLEQAGYSCAFLTHSDVVTGASAPFALPRICIPDRPIELEEFCARTRGGGILRQRLKATV